MAWESTEVATKKEIEKILAESKPEKVKIDNPVKSKVKMNYNSSKNQEIKRKFVEREVLYCVSSLIYELAKKDEYFEELMPVLQQPDYDAAISEIIREESEEDVLGYLGIAHKDNIQETIDNMFNSDKEDMCNHFYAEPEDIEALEHWIVSDWLAKKLEAQDEMITHDFLGLTIWGRTTSGQAILLDGVISRICEDLEILEGQKHEWEV